jgi:hypothetical protein
MLQLPYAVEFRLRMAAGHWQLFLRQWHYLLNIRIEGWEKIVAKKLMQTSAQRSPGRPLRGIFLAYLQQFNFV